MTGDSSIFNIPKFEKPNAIEPDKVDIDNEAEKAEDNKKKKKHISVVLMENHKKINDKVNELNGYYKDLDRLFNNRYKFIRYKQDMLSDKKVFAIMYNRIMAKSNTVWGDIMVAYETGEHYGNSSSFLSDEELANPPSNESGRKARERAVKAKIELLASEINEHITYINDTIKNIEHMHYSIPHIIEMYKINNNLI
jgi:hypothetical protein